MLLRRQIQKTFQQISQIGTYEAKYTAKAPSKDKKAEPKHPAKNDNKTTPGGCLKKEKVNPKLCANISFMFTESPLQHRYHAAKVFGFKAVESEFPFGYQIDYMAGVIKISGIEQVLMSSYAGDTKGCKLGLASIPGLEHAFQEGFKMTVDYAKAMKVKKIHILSGNITECTKFHDEVYESNLHFALDLLIQNELIGLIEPMNPNTFPNYYLKSYDRAVQLITTLNSPNLRLLLNIFHLQQIDGNIEENINTLMPYVGHVQVAQVPNRDEPNNYGEITYPLIFKTLKTAGYDDWIGLEYTPASSTKSGLKWINEFGYTL